MRLCWRTRIWACKKGIVVFIQNFVEVLVCKRVIYGVQAGLLIILMLIYYDLDSEFSTPLVYCSSAYLHMDYPYRCSIIRLLKDSDLLDRLVVLKRPTGISQ